MADAGCTYAVVNKSKKKKNHSQDKGKEKDSSYTMALYSVVEKHNTDPEEMDHHPTLTEEKSAAPRYTAGALYSVVESEKTEATSIPEAIVTTTFTAGDTTNQTETNKVSNHKKAMKFFTYCILGAAVAFILLIFISFVCLGVLFGEINNLKKETAALSMEHTSSDGNTLNSSLVMEQLST